LGVHQVVAVVQKEFQVVFERGHAISVG
jgi:hypothetical protein